MAILAVRIDERIESVKVTDAELIVRLREGRRLAAPLAWFPRRRHACTTCELGGRGRRAGDSLAGNRRRHRRGRAAEPSGLTPCSPAKLGANREA